MGPAGYRGPKWPEIGSNRPKLSKSVFFMIFQPKTSKTYAEISSSNFGTIFGHFGQNGPFWPWCPNFRSCYRAEMKSATPKTPTYQIPEGSGWGQGGEITSSGSSSKHDGDQTDGDPTTWQIFTQTTSTNPVGLRYLLVHCQLTQLVQWSLCPRYTI